MTCAEFDAGVIDLVRLASPSDVVQAATAHAGACRRCRARLDAERSLTAALRQLGASRRHHRAPADLEQRLLATLAQSVPIATAAQTVPVAPRRGRTSARPTPPSMHQGLRGRAPESPEVRARFVAAFKAKLATAALLTLAVAGAILIREGLAPERSTAGHQTQAAVEAPPVMTTPASLPAEADSRASRERIAPPPAVRRRPDRPTSTPDQAAAVDEPFVGFVPLRYDRPGALESGHIVRIALPRSAVASLGLPVNEERLDDRVEADVIIGEDGLAHAIRFVAIGGVR